MHADHARMQIVRFMHPASQPARHARPVPYGQNFLPRGTHCRHIERPIAAASPTWLTQTLTQDIEESPQQEVHTSRVLLVRGTTAIYPNDLHVLEFDHRKRNVHIGCSMMSRPSTIDHRSSILHPHAWARAVVLVSDLQLQLRTLFEGSSTRKLQPYV